MATSGTSFDIDIDAQASSVEPAAAAVARLAQRLTDAGAAADAANAAVRAGGLSYKQAESAADSAAKALERVNVAAEAQRGKLAAALDAGDTSGAERAQAALDKLTAKQAQAEARASSMRAALGEQAESLDRLRAAAVTAESAVSNLTAEQAAWSRTAEVIKAQNDAITKSFIKRSAEEVKAAKQANAAREASEKAARGTGKVEDALDGVAKLSGPLGGTVMQVKDAAEGFSKLSSSLGSAGPYVAIAAALIAVSLGLAAVTAAAAVGIGKITLWAVRLSDKQDEIGKEMKRLDKGFKSLFSGLKIDRLLGSLSSIVDLFDETNASGRAIKVVFESLFQPIVDGVADFLPKVRTAFIEFQIMALKALIAIKPYGSTILQVAKVLAVVAAVVTGVVVIAFGVLAAGIALVAVGFTALIALVTAVAASAVYLGMKLAELATAVGSTLAGAFNKAVEFLRALDLSQVGSDIIQGLVNGILGSGPKVFGAMANIAQGAIDSAKKTLGIASPAKRLVEVGEDTGAGMVVGVDNKAGEVQNSLESMVSPPEATGAASSSSSSSGSSGAGANLSGAMFNFYGVQGAEDAVSRFADVMTQILEGDASQLGAEVPA